jgi:hypothetical protein
MHIVKGMNGDSNLMEIIRAAGATRRLAGSLNGRKQQANEYADDGDDNEKLYQGETSKSVRIA